MNPSPLRHITPSPGQVDRSWLAARSSTRWITEEALVGGRFEHDVLLGFEASMARVSLIGWHPDPPKLCSWGAEVCPAGTLTANRLLRGEDEPFSIELVCEPFDSIAGSGTSRTLCATCSLPANGARGTLLPVSALVAEPCPI